MSNIYCKLQSTLLVHEFTLWLKNRPWSSHQSGENKKKDEEIIDKSSWIVIILLHCTSNYGYPVLYYVIWKKWMPYQTFPQISVAYIYSCYNLHFEAAPHKNLIKLYTKA
jgi:hypothetical protein